MTDNRTVCINGTWFTARWRLSAVDLDTGTVSLTCTVPDHAHTALTVRLDMATVQRLREEAGFTGPIPAAARDTYDCRTIDQRLTEMERSRRLLDDRTANSAADLRRKLDALVAEYYRLSAAIEARQQNGDWR